MSACRSCGAEVRFVPSEKSGKSMILDAVPRKGVVLIWTLAEGHLDVIPKATEADEHTAAAVVDVFTDHHATCPKADDWKAR